MKIAVVKHDIEALRFERLGPAGQGFCGIPGAFLSARREAFLTRCQVFCKNVTHVKLEVVIIQKEAFINFNLIFFLKVVKQTEGK